MTKPKCPRCSECQGQNHHWIEDQPANLEHDYTCKHCGAVCNMDDEDEYGGADDMARHSTSKIVAAYIRDRAAQYQADSGSRLALEEVAAALDHDEHFAAYDAGEMDDLLTPLGDEETEAA